MSSRYTTRRKTKQTEPITTKGSQPKKSKISSLPEPEPLDILDSDSDDSSNIVAVVDKNSNHLSSTKPMKVSDESNSSENQDTQVMKSSTTSSKKNKNKTRVIQSSDSSSSSEDEESNSKLVPDFFTNIFAQTQQKLRSTDDFSEFNGCRKKNGTNGKDNSKTNKGSCSTSTSGRRYGKNRRRIADLPVEEMDTDTELDEDPLEAIRKAAAAEVVSIDSDSEKEEDRIKPSDNVLEDYERFKRDELDSSFPQVVLPTEADSSDIQFLSQSSYNDSPSKMDYSDIPDRVRIRIKFQAKTYEIDGFMNWDMHEVRKILGERTNVPYRDLLIYNNKDEKMEDGNTLEFYNFEVGDYLDATQSVTSASSSNGIKEKQPGDITLAFQKVGTKRVEKHEINVYKKDTFEEIRREVARALSLDTNKICFKFDGDVLSLDETPENLDLEDGDCLDLIIQDS